MIKTNGQTRGFTLIELLAVIMIIALLMVVLLPAMKGGRSAGRLAVCASNLKQINEAAASLMMDRTQGRTMTLGFGWVGILAGASSGQTGYFICPEDDGHIGRSTATISPEVRLAVYSGTTFLYYMSLEEGPLTRIRNESGNPGKPGYSYRLEFEDIRPSGGDMDFNDFTVDVKVKNENDIDVYPSKGSAGYHFNLEDSNGKVLLTDIGRQDSNGQRIQTKGRASYAVNTLTASIFNPQQSSWIYFLDFDDHTTTDPRQDDWKKWEDDYGEVSFARHNGFINTLWKNGSVLTKDPDDIRPDTFTILEKYWGYENR